MKNRGLLLFLMLAFYLPVSAASGTYVITDYGAVGDGKTLNTTAIRQAIEAAKKAGGGRIVVPPGTYLTGTILLASNMSLELQAGAVLKGSSNVRDYSLPGEGETFSAGARDTASIGLITVRDAVNVSILGPGTIDGSGTSFMDLEKLHNPIDYLPERTRQRRDFTDPVFGSDDGPVLPRPRPERMILFSNCKNVVLRDLVLVDSPCWTVHLADCDGVNVDGVRIHNNMAIPNSDGIHCTSSKNIHISGCDIRAGDDGIIVSGLGDKAGVSEHVTVANCTITSRSAGIRVGYGENDIRDCIFQNLVIYSSNRGLGVFARDNGSISNILFSDIIIDTRLHTGHWWGKGEPIHVSAIAQTGQKPVGQIQGVRFSNVQAKSQTGIVVYGVKESVIRDLWVDKVALTITNGPLSETYGGNFDLRPTANLSTNIFEHDIPGLYCGYVSGLRIRDFQLRWQGDLCDYFTSGIKCENFEDVLIEGFDGTAAPTGGDSPPIELINGKGATIR